MPSLGISFDYPITRPYPWRFTTTFIILLSITVFSGLLYFNLLVVGLSTFSYLSTTFEVPKSPSWTDRMNIGKSLNLTLGCDSTTLVSGGTYRTPNGAFTYTIQNFVEKESRDVFSGLSYNGTSLDNCFVQSMGMFANYVSFDAMFEATINCTLAGNIELIATTPTLVTLRSDTESSIAKRFDSALLRKGTRSTYMAPAISRLLVAFGLDFINQFLLEIPTKFDDRPVTTVYSAFEIQEDHAVFYNDGTWSAAGAVSQNPRLTGTYSNKSIGVFENFAQVLWSAILSDLGASSSLNILTNVDLMNQVIHLNLDVPQGITYNWINGTAADYVMGNLTVFSLPFNETQPVPFNARYLCHSLWWKPLTGLVVDVLVATVSLFMVYWGLLNLALKYFAVGSSAKGNFCICPTCSSSVSEDIALLAKSKQQPSTDSRSEYASLSTFPRFDSLATDVGPTK